MRLLTGDESNNHRTLVKYIGQGVLMHLTPTGHRKKIQDATKGVRSYFVRHRIHDYSLQLQGPVGKKRVETILHWDQGANLTETSLYRPETKQGDPRMWPSGLHKFADPGDILEIWEQDDRLHLVNLSRTTLAADEEVGTESPLLAWLKEQYARSGEPTAIGLLREEAKAWRAGDGSGDTAVGRHLETRLGIKMNSSKLPDYLGYELKAGRAASKTRRNLFAHVPNWADSLAAGGCGSSGDILQRYGYDVVENGKAFRRLYVTVSGARVNPQGLRLVPDPVTDRLLEVHATEGMVAIWRMQDLREHLVSKHARTLWIEVETRLESGFEYFRPVRVSYTRDPLVDQLEQLIEDGHVTLDHLIKDEDGRVREKGPLFKTDSAGLALLFAKPIVYDLRT